MCSRCENSRLLWEMIQFERLLFFLDLDGSTTNWPCVRSKYYVYKILNMCFFFCLSDSSSKETRKEGTNQKDIIKKNVKNAHENT